jgi:hypothetical protein
MTPHTSRVGSRGSQSLPGVYQCAAVALSRRYRPNAGASCSLVVGSLSDCRPCRDRRRCGRWPLLCEVRNLSHPTLQSSRARFQSLPLRGENPTAYRSTKSMVFVGPEFPYMHQHRADALLLRDELEMCRLRFQVRVAGNPPPEMKRALAGEDGTEADTIVKLKGPLFGTKQSASCYCRNKFLTRLRRAPSWRRHRLAHDQIRITTTVARVPRCPRALR